MIFKNLTYLKIITQKECEQLEFSKVTIMYVSDLVLKKCALFEC